MRSLTGKIMKLIQIVLCICVFVACNQKAEKTPFETKNHCCEKGYLKIVIQYTDKADTLYLLPQEVITNQMVDSVLVEKAQRINNYNPGFINMILTSTDTDDVLVFSKENHYDISLLRKQWMTHLNIDDKGRGSYHISSDPGEKPFEIQFTPEFTAILLKLKNQKISYGS